jgi:hypothetical protein
MATQFKASTVFHHSEIKTEVKNPNDFMDMYIRALSVLPCLHRDLR